MKKVGPVTQEKQSYIFTYTFEDQEFKLKEGKRATIANNLFPDQTDSAGTIIELNHEKKYLRFKKLSTIINAQKEATQRIFELKKYLLDLLKF